MGKGTGIGAGVTRDVPFTVEADLDLGARIAPYLVATEGDVVVRAGSVPETLADVTARGVAYSINAAQFLLELPGGARYLVEEGQRITYDRRGASDREVALFLLGSAWAALCYQRGLLPLHASAIVDEGRVHAFTGPSGAGKSTLAAALAGRGRAFFTDDVLIVDGGSDALGGVCYAGQKDLKLWEDALALTGAAAAGPVRDKPDFAKFFADPAHASSAGSGRLASLTILGTDAARLAGGRFAMTALSGGRAIQQLRDSVYRPRFALGIWGRERLYQAIARMIAGVSVQIFDRRTDREDFAASTAFIDGRIAEREPARDG